MAFMELLKEKYDIITLEDFARKVDKLTNEQILQLYEALLDDLLEEPLLCSLCLEDIKDTVKAKGDIPIYSTASMCVGLLSADFVESWEGRNLAERVKGLWNIIKEVCRNSRELVAKYAPILMRRLTSVKGYRRLDSISFSFSVTGPDIVFTFKKLPGVSKKTARKKKSP